MHRALVLFLALVPTVGCGGGGSNNDTPMPPDSPVVPIDAEVPPIDAPVAPVFRNPITLSDDLLAIDALKILGAPVPGAAQNSCNECHSLTRQQLRNWRALSDTAMSSCLTDLQVASAASARTMIDCIRAMPELPTSDFLAKKLGIYSAAAHLSWFDFTVKYAYGPTNGQAAATELVTSAGMPRTSGSATPLTQAQFDIVAEWFVRGLPQLEQRLPQDPPPATCDSAVSNDVATHVNAMKLEGWRALNKTSMMAMFGCGASTNPLQCLTAFPFGSSKPYGTGWDVAGQGKLRVLTEVSYRSSYWTRSSPDGRFVGHGAQNVSGSIIIDLQRSALQIPVNALYDPNWFPDNSGFIFQGAPRNTCAQSVLTSNPAALSMTEPGCTSLTSIGLYEHVGALANGDHFAVDSRFISDDGGHFATLSDPSANFGSNASVGFIPLVYDGTQFSTKAQVTVPSPFEGDTVMSPSAKLIVSRVEGPGGNQLGYVLRKVVATPIGPSYAIETPEVARYCLSGGKPGFSYDERWMVYHHYITAADAVEMGYTGPSDPAFAPYLQKGGANIFLLELATGAKKRITNMHAGQYALFPHFRSDGWIYAAVRDGAVNREYMVASDAALLYE